MKDLKLIISSILILSSFFVGYTLGNEKNIKKLNELSEKVYYVNIEMSKTKIDISKPNNVIIKINGEETNTGSIDIK
ncbi:MAG: hypothetical protein PHH06_00030 [Candidatus Gracilibacteria bacterium]|nr:hypothetical protein [Candidatus Gracilibacteria bacterium]